MKILKTLTISTIAVLCLAIIGATCLAVYISCAGFLLWSASFSPIPYVGPIVAIIAPAYLVMILGEYELGLLADFVNTSTK